MNTILQMMRPLSSTTMAKATATGASRARSADRPAARVTTNSDVRASEKNSAMVRGRPAFIGCVGSDDGGGRLLADLSAAGVDVSRCQVLDGRPTPISAVLVDDAGRRVVVNHAAPELFHAADASRATDLGSADFEV